MRDYRALANCRFWMQSDISVEGRELLNYHYSHCFCSKFKISCLKFFYTILESKNKFHDCPVSLPVNSHKVKKILKREGSFDIFIKFYDQIEQIFNNAVHFMWNPNSLLILDDTT